MKGVVTPQHRDYLLLTYNNNFLHHACRVTPQPFCKFSHDTPTNDKHNSRIQMNSLNQSALRELRGTLRKGNVCYSKIFIAEGEAWHICQLPAVKKTNKRPKQAAHSVFCFQYSLKTHGSCFHSQSWGFNSSGANSDSAVDDGGQIESSH